MSDVLREGFSGFVGESGNPNVVIDGKSGVSPVDQAGCQGGTDQILLEEKLDDHPAEILRHSFDIPEGDMDVGRLSTSLSSPALIHPWMSPGRQFPSKRSFIVLFLLQDD